MIRKLLAVEEQQKELWRRGGAENFWIGCFVIYFYRYSPMQKKKHAGSVLIGNSERQTPLGRLIVICRIIRVLQSKSNRMGVAKWIHMAQWRAW